MNRQEFDALTDNYSPLDEIVIISPGGKELALTELDYDAIDRTGKICIKTFWAGRVDDDGEIIPKPKPKKKYKKKAANRTKGPVVRTGLRGRPRRLRDENGRKVERGAKKKRTDPQTDPNFSQSADNQSTNESH